MPDSTELTNFIHKFDGLFSSTTWVSRHQKSYTILNFNEAGDDAVAEASAGPLCKSFVPRSTHARQHLIAQFFYRADVLPDAQPTVSKHCRQLTGWLVGRLQFNISFQHKYGYIRDEGN